MIIKAQRLRNLTTGKLHTEMDDIYKDLCAITGEKGLMTHMLPRAMEAITPWLKKHVTDERYWDETLDLVHRGEVDLPEPSKEDRAEMFTIFQSLTNPLTGVPNSEVKTAAAHGKT